MKIKLPYTSISDNGRDFTLSLMELVEQIKTDKRMQVVTGGSVGLKKMSNGKFFLTVSAILSKSTPKKKSKRIVKRKRH